MSDPIPMQNPSAAAYMEIDGAEVEYGASGGPGGRPIVRIIPGGATGQQGQVTVSLADGLNVLADDEFKKSIIKLDDDSIIASATVELPEVTDDLSGAYRRNFFNNTTFDVTITNGGAEEFVLAPGLSMDIIGTVEGIRPAISVAVPNTGEVGMATVPLVDELTILTASEYKKGVINLTGGDGTQSAVFPEVTDNETGAYTRTVLNSSEGDVTLVCGEFEFDLAQGLHEILAFTADGIQQANTGMTP